VAGWFAQVWWSLGDADAEGYYIWPCHQYPLGFKRLALQWCTQKPTQRSDSHPSVGQHSAAHVLKRASFHACCSRSFPAKKARHPTSTSMTLVPLASLLPLQEQGCRRFHACLEYKLIWALRACVHVSCTWRTTLWCATCTWIPYGAQRLVCHYYTGATRSM
jgi:hypothetical protein